MLLPPFISSILTLIYQDELSSLYKENKLKKYEDINIVAYQATNKQNINRVATSNRIAYKERFILNDINTKLIELGGPSLKCIKGLVSKFTRIWFVWITITNKINCIYPMWFCKNWNIFSPMVTVKNKKWVRATGLYTLKDINKEIKRKTLKQSVNMLWNMHDPVGLLENANI